VEYIKIRFGKNLEEMHSRLQRTVDEMFRQVNPMLALPQQTWRPQMDIYETSEEIIIIGEISGVGPSRRRPPLRGSHQDERETCFNFDRSVRKCDEGIRDCSPSFVRSHAKSLGISEDFYENHGIHIHVPAGAIPKDGPPAGVTMLAALASLLTKKTVASDLAMTGEITLRGQVLPVGGVKEKVKAAHRAGIKTVILPTWNEKDLEDVPKKVRTALKFHFVDTMDEVLKIALPEL
jgi:hypothetical protein